MKKIIVSIGIFVLLSPLGFFFYFAYYLRDQTIDFVSMLPDELTHCRKTITNNDERYNELTLWLNSNKDGWKNSPSSYITEVEFIGKDIFIYILDDLVAINYRADTDEWTQLTKTANTDSLYYACPKSP